MSSKVTGLIAHMPCQCTFVFGPSTVHSASMPGPRCLQLQSNLPIKATDANEQGLIGYRASSKFTLEFFEICFVFSPGRRWEGFACFFLTGICDIFSPHLLLVPLCYEEPCAVSPLILWDCFFWKRLTLLEYPLFEYVASGVIGLDFTRSSHVEFVHPESEKLS